MINQSYLLSGWRTSQLLLLIRLCLTSINSFTLAESSTPTPRSLTDPYQILSYAADRRLDSFHSDRKELDFKLAFERALLFASHNPEWQPAVRQAVNTLKTKAARASYAAQRQAEQARALAELPRTITQALAKGDGVAVSQAVKRLHQTPGGDELLLVLTQQRPGLDYDYLRTQLKDDLLSQELIDYLNRELFGY